MTTQRRKPGRPPRSELRSPEWLQAVDKGLAAYAAGVSLSRAAKANGVSFYSMLKELLARGMRYVKARKGRPRGGTLHAMSARRSAKFKAVRGALLRAGDRVDYGIIASSVGVARQFVGQVAETLEQAGVYTRPHSRVREAEQRVRSAWKNGMTSGEVAEKATGVTAAFVRALAPRLRRAGKRVPKLLSQRSVTCGHMRMDDVMKYIRRNPRKGPIELAKALGLSVNNVVHARNKAKVRYPKTVKRLRRPKKPRGVKNAKEKT